MKKALTVIALLVVIMGLFPLADATTYTSYDEGHHGGTYGSDTYHSLGNKVIEIAVDAPWFEVHGWGWMGVELELENTEDVSMSASLTLTGYVSGTYSKLYIWARCINPATYVIEWGVRIYDKVGPYDWEDETLTLDLNLFPQETPSGTWLFIIHYEFYGSGGGYLQYSSGDSSRSVLEVNSITVNY